MPLFWLLLWIETWFYGLTIPEFEPDVEVYFNSRFSSHYQTLKNGQNALFWNSSFPTVIVLPKSEFQIPSIVTWASTNNLRVCPRSGGHSYEGYSSCTDGMLLDLQHLTGIYFSQDNKVVTVFAGEILGNLYYELVSRHVTLPMGTCNSVGIGGHALGGGFGYVTPSFGVLSDRMKEATVVLGNGTIITASTNENGQLFWALRGGGGGNFGVVTKFVFETVPVPEKTFLISQSWQAIPETTKEILHAYFYTWHEKSQILARAAVDSGINIGLNVGITMTTNSKSKLIELTGQIVDFGPRVPSAASSKEDVLFDELLGKSHIESVKRNLFKVFGPIHGNKSSWEEEVLTEVNYSQSITYGYDGNLTSSLVHYIEREPFNPFNFKKLTSAVFNHSAIMGTDAAVDALIDVVLESVSESEVNHILEISFLGNATTKLSNLHPKDRDKDKINFKPNKELKNGRLGNKRKNGGSHDNMNINNNDITDNNDNNNNARRPLFAINESKKRQKLHQSPDLTMEPQISNLLKMRPENTRIPNRKLEAMMSQNQKLPLFKGRKQINLDSSSQAIAISESLTAFPWQNNFYFLQFQSAFSTERHAQKEIGKIQQFKSKMRPFTMGHYVNMIDENDAVNSYYGLNNRKLKTVKCIFDPQNLFRFPQNIVNDDSCKKRSD